MDTLIVLTYLRNGVVHVFVCSFASSLSVTWAEQPESGRRGRSAAATNGLQMFPWPLITLPPPLSRREIYAYGGSLLVALSNTLLCCKTIRITDFHYLIPIEKCFHEMSRKNEKCVRYLLSIWVVSVISTETARWLSGRASDLRSSSRGFEAWPRRCCVTTLGKLFTPYCLCHQAV